MDVAWLQVFGRYNAVQCEARGMCLNACVARGKELFCMGKEVQVCRHECVGVCGEVSIVRVACTCCVG